MSFRPDNVAGRRTLAQIRDDIMKRLELRPCGLHELRNAARINYRTLKRELVRMQALAVVTQGEIFYQDPESGEQIKEKVWRLVK